MITKAIMKKLEKKEVKDTFYIFIVNIVKIVLWIIVGLIFLQILKIPMTPLVAVLGTLGIGVGLALKDHMSNIAGGIIIAVNKQFEVGDYIKCSDMEGMVEDVELFFTKLKTFDNKAVYAPNSIFSSNNVFNYTKNDMRRVDVSIGVSYDASFDEVKSVVAGILDANELIKKEPEYFIGIKEYGDSSINIIIKVWTDTSEYWNVFYYINDMLKREFDKKGIEIPFPQLDVHTD
jgi:small conductance mechanosensitive channel